MTKKQFIKKVSKIDQTFEDEFKAEYNSPELIWKVLKKELAKNNKTIRDWQMWEDCILSFLRSEKTLRGKFNNHVQDWNTHTKLPPSAYENK